MDNNSNIYNDDSFGDSSLNDDQFIDLSISGQNFGLDTILARRNSKVEELKRSISSRINYPINRIRLMSGKSILKDDQPLSFYNLESGSNLKLIILADNSSHTNSAALKPKNPSSDDALMNLLSKSPLIKEMLKSPDILQQIFNSNPQFKELVKNNPEFKTVFEDPSNLEQIFATAQNPQLMKEMLRNNDRVISNLEMQPGGFNYLAQMYNNVQKPLESFGPGEISQEQSRISNARLSKLMNVKPTSKDRINTDPLPNPWSFNNTPNQSNLSGVPRPGGAAGRKSPNPLSSTGHNRPSNSSIHFHKKKSNSPLIEDEIMKDFNGEAAHPLYNDKNGSNLEASFLSSQPSGSADNAYELNQESIDAKVQVLVDMGFTNKELIQRALEVTNGDINLAVEWLFRQQ
ncbi:hypothetical protein BB560_003341 [Smittium megazygosporum]|uniref:UBA domain-containing protein n=1 Tax=Smittium megazygosporum TaxID=133381 RepID=A0A2T9ZC88_9FUNG|nr:hypothetical protein BB560_003341 [Smittium megazygosporum]